MFIYLFALPTSPPKRSNNPSRNRPRFARIGNGFWTVSAGFINQEKRHDWRRRRARRRFDLQLSVSRLLCGQTLLRPRHGFHFAEPLRGHAVTVFAPVIGEGREAPVPGTTAIVAMPRKSRGSTRKALLCAGPYLRARSPGAIQQAPSPHPARPAAPQNRRDSGNAPGTLVAHSGPRAASAAAERLGVSRSTVKRWRRHVLDSV